RTDIFAFGSLVYEMLTGKKAFEGESQASLIGAIMHAEPEPIVNRQPLTPSALERTIRTCLAKNPDDRWQSARDLARELTWVSEGDRVSSPQASNRGIRRRLVALSIAAGLLGVAVVGLAVALALKKAPPDSHVTRFSVSLPSGTQLNPSIGRVAVLSPDGHKVALVALDRGQSELWVHSFDSGTSVLIPGSDGVAGPTWSPDGRHLAFVAMGKLKRVDATGGPVQTVCDVTPTALGL